MNMGAEIASASAEEKIMAKGVVEYLKSSLCEVNAEMIEFCNRYGVVRRGIWRRNISGESLRKRVRGVTSLG
jgi:hypothetical protein